MDDYSARGNAGSERSSSRSGDFEEKNEGQEDDEDSADLHFNIIYFFQPQIPSFLSLRRHLQIKVLNQLTDIQK